MRTLKFILGIICVVASLCSGIVALAAYAAVHWSRLDPVVFYAVVSALVFCSLGLGAVGLFIIVKRQAPIPTKALTLVVVGILAGIAILSAHGMTSLEMAAEEIRKIHDDLTKLGIKSIEPPKPWDASKWAERP